MKGGPSLNITLQTPLREQAGSDTYNRYEYQVHWIVCEIIKCLEEETDCIIFCEYHDDMARSSNASLDCFEYYQIKTREDNEEWSIVDLSKKAKRKDGTYKSSFLGFIFYNFMTFGTECSHCYFVSNAPLDIEIRTWQAIIEDEESLKLADPGLYAKIKERLETELGLNKPQNFDVIFDKFVQNTFIQQDDLQLTGYEDQTEGRFFRILKKKKMPSDTAHLIHEQLVNTVRSKSKQHIDLPISKKKLISKKGIQISEFSAEIEENISKESKYIEFEAKLKNAGIDGTHLHNLLAARTSHDIRRNNIKDILYQDCINIMVKAIVSNIGQSIDSLEIIFDNCIQALKNNDLPTTICTAELVEVLYYELRQDA